MRHIFQSFSTVPRCGRSRPHRSLRLSAAVLAVCLFLVSAGQCRTAQAALHGNDSVTLEETWNPRPDSVTGRDILLPMPKGLFMVFRVVAVPSAGLLDSLPLQMGVGKTDPERRVYDSGRTDLLSAPFTARDIPPAWRMSLPPGAEARDYSYYLIAKYEVSRLQWKVVMDDLPDISSLDPSDARPVTDISWHDAVRFTERYTEWLLKNHPEALPRFAGDSRNTGFVRLPTEAEWEYAARGGQREENLLQDFFSMKKGHRLNDYAVYREAETSVGAEGLQRIGSRLPNPLGLHDTAGNAAEMTADFFRFSAGRGLHGSAGGFVCKGGSFHSSRKEVMPGRREELSPYLKDGPQRAPDLGFRPVVSGINTPGGWRPAALQAESAGRRRPSTQKAPAASARAQSAETAPDMEPYAAATPLEELDRLISQEKNHKIRQNLLSLRAELTQSQWDAGTVIFLLLVLLGFASLLRLAVLRERSRAQASSAPFRDGADRK